MSLRVRRRIHLWVSIPGSLFLLVWLASGVAMVSEQFRGDPHTGGVPEPVKADLRQLHVSLADVVADVEGPIREVSLFSVGNRPFARLALPDRSLLVDARTGFILSPVDERLAKELLRGYAGAPPARVTRIEKRDLEYRFGSLPAWRGEFGDGRILHIAESDGAITSWSDRHGMAIRALYFIHSFQFTDSAGMNATLGFFALLWGTLSLISGALLFGRKVATVPDNTAPTSILAILAILAILSPSASAAPHEPHRIVTLVPSAAEVLDGLGLADRIVGVTEYTDVPPGMKDLPRVGAFNNLNVEAIVALKPDLAVATTDGNSPAVIDRLRRLGVDVFVLDLRYWETIRKSITDLGAYTSRATPAGELVAEMDRVAACVKEATAKASRPRVLFAFDIEPVIAPGKGSFTNQLIEMAGGNSLTREMTTPYPRLAIENVIALKPDMIVVSTMNPDADVKRWKKWLAPYGAIPAVKNGRIMMVDSRTIDRPSQRLVIGLRELAATLHPELFPAGTCQSRWGSATK